VSARLRVGAARLAPPAEGEPPAAVRAWLGRLAEALDEGRELPPAARERLAGALRRVALGRSADAALGLARLGRPRLPASRASDRRFLALAAILGEAERRRAGGERVTLSAVVAYCASTWPDRVDPSWSPRADPLRGILESYRRSSAANARHWRELFGRSSARSE